MIFSKDHPKIQRSKDIHHFRTLWFLFRVYLFVGEGSNAAGLILKTGLSSLLYIAHVPQIPDQNSSSSSANYQPISSHRERVHLTGRDAKVRKETEWNLLYTLQTYGNIIKITMFLTAWQQNIIIHFTFSGWVKVPALHGVLGSHSRTDLSQLPVTMTLTSGQYSTQRIGASCVPTTVSVCG